MRKGEEMKRAIIVIVFVLFNLSPTLASANEASDLPESFIKLILEGKVSNAVDQYFSSNPLMSQQTQQIQMVKTQIEGAFQVIGKPFSFEIIAVDDLAPSLRRFVFITKHENNPLTWEFYVYKPKDKWIAANMNFNDNFSLTAPRK